MSGWGCPHEVEGKCQRVKNLPCDIGMKGCVLFGRFRFADDSKNRPKKSRDYDKTMPPFVKDENPEPE